MLPDGCRIDIADNGKGMSPEELESLRILLVEKADSQTALTMSAGEKGNASSGTRVGLLNIHRRLQLGYGGTYGLKLDSREGFWTRVTLLVPTYADDK